MHGRKEGGIVESHGYSWSYGPDTQVGIRRDAKSASSHVSSPVQLGPDDEVTSHRVNIRPIVYAALEGSSEHCSFRESRIQGEPRAGVSEVFEVEDLATDYVMELWDPTISAYVPLCDMNTDTISAFRKAFESIYLQNDAKKAEWKRLKNDPRECNKCIGLIIVSRGNANNEYLSDDRQRACLRCTRAKRPCAKMLGRTTAGKPRVGWLPLVDELRANVDIQQLESWILVPDMEKKLKQVVQGAKKAGRFKGTA